MITVFLTLISALAISAIAAYFSIIGLIAIFPTTPWAIAVMGGSLELAKLVTASWLYRNWLTAPRTIKYYFTLAVLILSLITTMGIFGYLSKAHMDQSVPIGDVAAKVAMIDERINVQKENIETSRKILRQLDEAVDNVMSRSNDTKGAERAVQIRKSQQKERSNLNEEIQTAQQEIKKLTEERAPLAMEARKVEAEVGPIKYIAALMYGDNPDQNLLERAVRWVIILIVMVFDPLAILLLIAANITLREINGEAMEEITVDFQPKQKRKYTKKSKWSKELQDVDNKVGIDKSRIYEIPKEILDKVFRSKS
jgi:hypothetical protein